MHTVIILSKHTSELLKDFRFLFKPFVIEGTISFCDWNESGTDVQSSVPDLYKKIKGKQNWRAVVITTDSMHENSKNPIADEKNPFDFSEEAYEDGIPRESRVPLIRLSHMLCGYPSLTVKNFEKGFEYLDEDTGEICRVRLSELPEEKIYYLSDKYGEQLKSIYLEEQISDEVRNAHQALLEKYTFTDTRPRELIMVSTRKHCNDEDHIYASWKTQLEMESSNFCGRNNYPSICRFLCYSITNPENSMYMKELVEFWLAVLTLSINSIPASTLQAYKLYRLGLNVSEEELGGLLNNHLNRMSAVYQLIRERLKMRPEYSFEVEEDLVERQNIPVIFEGISAKDLFVDTKQIGLSRNCPRDELIFWNFEVREKQRDIEKYLKTPRRAIDKASQYLKDKAESFYGDEYELDKFQVIDLEEEIQHLEAEVLASDTRSIVDEVRIRAEIQKADKQVKKDISVRMRKETVVKIGVLLLVLYLAGYLPYVVNATRLGTEPFFSSFVLALGAVLVTAIGGVVALFLLRGRLIESIERFNDAIRNLIDRVNSSADKFEDYFSIVCSYMKAQSIYEGIRLKEDSVSSERFKLRAHKQALRVCMERDEELAASYGIKRNVEAVRNVTSFFNEEKLPKDNSLYFFEPARSNAEIPINDAGDLIRAPYTFVSKLFVEREDVFDDMKGEY